VELEYREKDVRVRGRTAPALAAELTAAGDHWTASLAEASNDGVVAARG
jgi:hypothetical protein